MYGWKGFMDEEEDDQYFIVRLIEGIFVLMCNFIREGDICNLRL